MTKKTRYSKTISSYLLILGIISIIFGLYLRNNNKIIVPEVYSSANSSKDLLIQNIRIENADIDIKVTDSKIVAGVWEISESFANHLIGSAYPNENGNIVIYGHNTEDIFKNLEKVEIGDTVILKDATGIENSYRVNEIFEVNAHNIEVIKPTIGESLTIFTCSGILDSKRLIVKASPVI